MKILWKFGSVNIWDFDYAYDHWLGIGFHKDSVFRGEEMVPGGNVC